MIMTLTTASEPATTCVDADQSATPVDPQVCHGHALSAWWAAQHVTAELRALIKAQARCERQGRWHAWERHDLCDALRQAARIEAALRNQVELAPLHVREADRDGRTRRSGAVAKQALHGGMR